MTIFSPAPPRNRRRSLARSIDSFTAGARDAADRFRSSMRPSVDRGTRDASPRSEASLTHYATLLESEAQIAGVPVDLLQAICWFASGWRQFEPSGSALATPTPHGTLYGCMQLNDVWHPDAFPAAMTDAQGSIRYAAALLIWLNEQLGDWNRATIAFFGHDRRAELAARRVQRYRITQPWNHHRADHRPNFVDRARTGTEA